MLEHGGLAVRADNADRLLREGDGGVVPEPARRHLGLALVAHLEVAAVQRPRRVAVDGRLPHAAQRLAPRPGGTRHRQLDRLGLRDVERALLGYPRGPLVPPALSGFPVVPGRLLGPDGPVGLLVLEHRGPALGARVERVGVPYPRDLLVDAAGVGHGVRDGAEALGRRGGGLHVAVDDALGRAADGAAPLDDLALQGLLDHLGDRIVVEPVGPHLAALLPDGAGGRVLLPDVLERRGLRSVPHAVAELDRGLPRRPLDLVDVDARGRDGGEVPRAVVVLAEVPPLDDGAVLAAGHRGHGDGGPVAVREPSLGAPVEVGEVLLHDAPELRALDLRLGADPGLRGAGDDDVAVRPVLGPVHLLQRHNDALRRLAGVLGGRGLVPVVLGGHELDAVVRLDDAVDVGGRGLHEVLDERVPVLVRPARLVLRPLVVADPPGPRRLVRPLEGDAVEDEPRVRRDAEEILLRRRHEREGAALREPRQPRRPRLPRAVGEDGHALVEGHEPPRPLQPRGRRESVDPLPGRLYGLLAPGTLLCVLSVRHMPFSARYPPCARIIPNRSRPRQPRPDRPSGRRPRTRRPEAARAPWTPAPYRAPTCRRRASGDPPTAGSRRPP